MIKFMRAELVLVDIGKRYEVMVAAAEKVSGKAAKKAVLIIVLPSTSAVPSAIAGGMIDVEK